MVVGVSTDCFSISTSPQKLKSLFLQKRSGSKVIVVFVAPAHDSLA